MKSLIRKTIPRCKAILAYRPSNNGGEDQNTPQPSLPPVNTPKTRDLFTNFLRQLGYALRQTSIALVILIVFVFLLDYGRVSSPSNVTSCYAYDADCLWMLSSVKSFTHFPLPYPIDHKVHQVVLKELREAFRRGFHPSKHIQQWPVGPKANCRATSSPRSSCLLFTLSSLYGGKMNLSWCLLLRLRKHQRG